MQPPNLESNFKNQFLNTIQKKINEIKPPLVKSKNNFEVGVVDNFEGVKKGRETPHIVKLQHKKKPDTKAICLVDKEGKNIVAHPDIEKIIEERGVDIELDDKIERWEKGTFTIKSFTHKEYIRFYIVVVKALDTYSKQMKELEKRLEKEKKERERGIKRKRKLGRILTSNREHNIKFINDWTNKNIRGTANKAQNVSDQKLQEIIHQNKIIKIERRKKKDEFLKDIQTIKEDIKESKEERKKEDLEADIQKEQIDKTK